MSRNSQETPFFIGYLPTPAGLKIFLVSVAAGFMGVFAALALAIGAAQDDPGPGEFLWSAGRQTVTGTVEAKPYPVMHVTEGSDRIPAGRTIMLSNPGKNGVQQRLDQYDGQMVTLSGIALKRGDIDFLQIGGGKTAIEVRDESTAPARPEPQSLGRWRLKGEMCDGKCLAGAMRPGRGLSHRACANLCLTGGIPPVFVSSAPVDGRDFFLMANKDGAPLPDSYLNYVSMFVSLDGEVERHGSLLIFKVDLDTLKVL